MAEDELEALRRDVRYLMDRTEILDCIANQSRGHDRHDVELMTSVFAEDGVDEHGTTVNSGPAYGEWANQVHSLAAQAHLHNITTHTCEIDGDEAHCESYVMVTMLGHDTNTATVIVGRYLDRLERTDGRWRIVVRRSTAEIGFTANASFLQSGMFQSQGYVKGTWDHDDLSYTRPLKIDSAAARWGA